MAVNFIGGGNWSTWRKPFDRLRITDHFTNLEEIQIDFVFFNDCS